ncbi:MAG TPA: copper transporter [Bacteroidetes bacterium]|nr:copper transporter [Bacteroidota bacterium]
MSTKSMNTKSPSQNPSEFQGREFPLTNLSLKNPISVLVLCVIFIIGGLSSYLSLPKEAQPDITIPNIVVRAAYPGVAPEDVETLVTNVLEDELANISEIKEMTSTSAEGYSSILLEFNSDVNIDEALLKVREKVDLAKSELPGDVEEPVVDEINLSQFPIMQVNISGEYGLDELKKVAEDLQDEIEALPQVLEVNLAGGLENEVKVDVDLTKLRYYNLAFDDITKAIGNENVTIPGGSIDVGTKKYLLRVPGEYEDPQGLEDIVVTTANDRPVYIRDVAEVRFAPKDRESYSYLDQSPVITLSVVKRTGENIIEASERVKQILKDNEALVPPTTTFKITSDMSTEIRKMVSSLENNIISGLILVIAVLLFFMGVRNSIFVGVAIPFSMFISFLVLTALGITLNMIVLFSLILALGMLVDNAIVVVENIYRYLEEGYTNIEAAKKGTGEVAIPIISGTTTTLAAFTPLAFWPGLVGEFMSYLPKTLIITLAASLFIGLVINPVLCALFMRVPNQEEEAQTSKMSKTGRRILLGVGVFVVGFLLIQNPVTWSMLLTIAGAIYLLHRYALTKVAAWWQTKGMARSIARYERSLGWALRHQWVVLLTTVGVFLSSFVMFGLSLGVFQTTKVEFFPEDIPPARLYAQISTPAGTNVETTREFIESLEQRSRQIPEISDVETIVATAGAPISSGMDNSGQTQNKGTIVLNFVDYEQREGSTFDAMENLRKSLPEDLAGAEVVIEKPQDGPPTGKPINLELIGDDMQQLMEISESIQRQLENSPLYAQLEGLDTDLPESRPELRIDVDRERAALFGLNTQEIGSTIRSAINGVEASSYRDGVDEYDITVRLNPESRENLSALSTLTVLTEGGQQIPLSEVVSLSTQEGYGGITHKDQKRVVTLSSDVSSAANPNQILGQVQAELANTLANLPQGVRYEWTGEQEEQADAIAFLSNAFLIALFLIAFILISQFNSVVKPIIVLTSVIMSISGVLYGLVIFQMPFVIIMTGIGIISLAGVVVNNAIVLIDYIDILRAKYPEKSTYDVLIMAGATRFRPVVLTAITTTLGLVPLAIGFNIDFFTFTNNPVEFFSNISEYLYWGGEQAAWWSPMAVAVIVGLIFATALTLILVPVLYLFIERVSAQVKGVFYPSPSA